MGKVDGRMAKKVRDKADVISCDDVENVGISRKMEDERKGSCQGR
jgi:hypothetical protein